MAEFIEKENVILWDEQSSREGHIEQTETQAVQTQEANFATFSNCGLLNIYNHL